MATRDIRAMGERIAAAPHQEILAKVVAIQSNFRACGNLATLARRGSSHIDRVIAARATKGVRVGGKVFIGHGRSSVWRELKDFIQDELGLQCDEFNRVEVAGTTTVARLQQLLDEAAFAFLVLTAEDERVDGTVVARENVVHEAGLFQGRLGFERAIIMLESGCNEFSNIYGLSQLRFESGKVDALFDRVRRTLKREGLIS
jgi:predicted nucleotide-binding protein